MLGKYLFKIKQSTSLVEKQFIANHLVVISLCKFTRKLANGESSLCDKSLMELLKLPCVSGSGGESQQEVTGVLNFNNDKNTDYDNDNDFVFIFSKKNDRLSHELDLDGENTTF